MRHTLAYVWEPKQVEGHDEAYFVFSLASLKLAGQFREGEYFLLQYEAYKITKVCNFR
jgi:hypothetical protein